MDHYIRNSALGELQLAEQETISAHLVKALGRPRGSWFEAASQADTGRVGSAEWSLWSVGRGRTGLLRT